MLLKGYNYSKLSTYSMQSYGNISDDLKRKTETHVSVSWLGYGPEIDLLTSIHKVLDFIYANEERKRKVNGKNKRKEERKK